jgi:NitT/TauT family transport system permease protein
VSTLFGSELPAEAPAATARSIPWTGHRIRLIRDRVVLVTVLLAAWEIAGRYVIDVLWISRPSLIAERLWSLAISGALWKHTELTVSEALLGLLLAFAVGIPAGIAMARFKYANAVVEPFLLGIYSLPRVALAPLFIIYFGIDLLSKVMMSFSTVVFIFMFNVHEGLKTVDPDLIDLMRTMRAPSGFVIRRVLLPWIVPWIIVSLRIGVGLSLVGAVVGELIGSAAGLGWYIEHSGGRLDTTGVFAGLVTLMMVAMLGNWIVARLSDLASSWRPASP